VMTPKRVTWLGLILNGLLALAKVAAGLLCRSNAILVDGIHSASDLVTDAIVLAGLRVSSKPADDDHHYGHQRVSTLVAMFVGAGLMGVGIFIAYKAVMTLHAPESDIRPTVPFWIALASVPIKEMLYQLTLRVAIRTNNIALRANAWHHRTDAMTSIAAAAGLAGVALGGPEWHFLDHVTAIVLAAFLVYAAIGIIREAANELIDQAPDEDVLDELQRIARETPGVRDYHAVRARKHGGVIEMDIHILVDRELPVWQGHDIASDVRHRIRNSDHDVREVIVHVEPYQSPSDG
jgi:cation diffusion facilitator family transporter